jgi:hypothetical protein
MYILPLLEPWSSYVSSCTMQWAFQCALTRPVFIVHVCMYLHVHALCMCQIWLHVSYIHTLYICTCVHYKCLYTVRLAFCMMLYMLDVNPLLLVMSNHPSVHVYVHVCIYVRHNDMRHKRMHMHTLQVFTACCTHGLHICMLFIELFRWWHICLMLTCLCEGESSMSCMYARIVHQVCTCAHAQTCAYVCVLYTHIHIYVYVYTYIYICARIHA